MGMDVTGRKPITADGECFSSNVWNWHPLWNYCCAVAPGITAKVKHGHTNDGDGLNKSLSMELARVLMEELASGGTAAYKKEYDSRLAAMPEEECTTCGGTGKRLSPPKTGPGKLACNGCGGKGKIKAWDTHYPFEVGTVKEFAEFLEGCGGFRIW